MLLTRLRAPNFDFESIRSEFGLSDVFDADVMREAIEARDLHADSRIDRTDIPFVTIDHPARRTSIKPYTSRRRPTAWWCTTRSPTWVRW